MIPREVLKKLRQLELRTNRIVAEFAEHGCGRRPSRSAWCFVNALEMSGVLRLALRTQPRSVSASPEGCQKLAGGRSASEDPRHADKTDTTLKGSQNRASEWLRTIL